MEWIFKSSMKKLIPLNRLIVFYIACGLLVFALEVYLQHYSRLQDTKIMWTPIIFGLTGGIMCLGVAIVFNRLSYYLFIILMNLSILVGLMGLYFHNKWRYPAFADLLFHAKALHMEMLTTFTPLVAPAAFIALGVLGLSVAFYEKW